MPLHPGEGTPQGRGSPAPAVWWFLKQASESRLRRTGQALGRSQPLPAVCRPLGSPLTPRPHLGQPCSRVTIITPVLARALGVGTQGSPGLPVLPSPAVTMGEGGFVRPPSCQATLASVPLPFQSLTGGGQAALPGAKAERPEAQGETQSPRLSLRQGLPPALAEPGPGLFWLTACCPARRLPQGRIARAERTVRLRSGTA